MGNAAGSLALGGEYFRRVLEQVADAVVTTDAVGRVTFVNPVAERLYGIPEAEAVGRPLTDLLSGFEAAGVGGLDAVVALLVAEGSWHGEITQHTAGGERLLMEASVVLLRGRDGRVEGSVSVQREISDRKLAETVLAHQATHDALTGLLSRSALLDAVTASLDARRRPTVVYCDLNGFKGINDRWGHQRGDEILQVVARRLAAAVRDGDVAGRVGGDELVLLAEGLDPADLPAYLDRLTAAVAEPIPAGDGTLHSVGVSIGVAAAVAGEDPDHLLRRADQAMYEAKRSTATSSSYRIG